MKQMIFAIIVFIVAVMAAQPINDFNFIVQVADIPDGDNGFHIRANCHNNGDGTFVITMDNETMKSSEWQVVMMHEIGHVINWEGSEEDADNFANAQGVGYIHDATY
jgi:hypothetical protein